MSPLTPELIKEALRQVVDSDTGQDIISAGMISGLVIRDAKVGFVVTIDPKDKERKSYLREACEHAVAKISGVESVTAVLTAQSSTPIPPKPESGYAQPRERAVWNMTPIEHVRSVIAIASGKGGVGKSTTAVNLALALQAQGKHIGLLDADIYGPSIPRMMGLTGSSGGQPEIAEGKMIPPQSHGIACMSMGFITGEEAAILRGPMISKTLHQLLRFTRWGTNKSPLDTLIVDMPPGTGDIHLSMVQQVPLTGAIIVTTPQEVATIDARKCIKMFLKLGTPVLGVIENMSYFIDSTGARITLFGEGGGKKLATEMGVPFLGEVPIDASIGLSADSGQRYSGQYADAYAQIIRELA
jgi:ATP-binding protein involved in chromosome partitioning